MTITVYAVCGKNHVCSHNLVWPQFSSHNLVAQFGSRNLGATILQASSSPATTSQQNINDETAKKDCLVKALEKKC